MLRVHILRKTRFYENIRAVLTTVVGFEGLKYEHDFIVTTPRSRGKENYVTDFRII